jgi:hypothetical protein
VYFLFGFLLHISVSVFILTYLHIYFLLDVVVEWLTFLIRFRETLGSHLGPETVYSDWGPSYMFSVLPGKSWDSTLKLGHDHFPSHPFQFIIHLSLHSTLYSPSHWKTSLNKQQTNKRAIYFPSSFIVNPLLSHLSFLSLFIRLYAFVISFHPSEWLDIYGQSVVIIQGVFLKMMTGRYQSSANILNAHNHGTSSLSLTVLLICLTPRRLCSNLMKRGTDPRHEITAQLLGNHGDTSYYVSTFRYVLQNPVS